MQISQEQKDKLQAMVTYAKAFEHTIEEGYTKNDSDYFFVISMKEGEKTIGKISMAINTSEELTRLDVNKDAIETQKTKIQDSITELKAL